MESKNNNYLIPILMAISITIGLFLGDSLSSKNELTLTDEESRYQKIQDIIQVLNRRYVDPVDGDAIFESTIVNMLHSLDPHSSYIAAEDLKKMNESIHGKFGGVGIRFFIIRDTVCVTNVLPLSPSLRAGLESGDKILEVDGKKITGIKITNEKVMDLLKGVEGTKVKLKLIRNGKKIKKTVVRGSIPVESVVAFYMINSEIGYVKINQFSVATATEFKEAAEHLIGRGLKKMIIDLRNNGGGVLTGATDIADEFLPENVPIVETRGAHSPTFTYRATSKGSLENIEVVILINTNSASASEILAGAIQDNDRGTIIGRRSFGKGLVQEDVLLRDGSNLRLTIARYYTPTGRCIQKAYTDDIKAYYDDQMERYDNGEMYKVDSSLFVDSLKFITPKGKVVYGGGGIMPDVFVPYDTSGSSWYLSELRYSSVFQTFAFDFVQDKRNKWKSPDEYRRSFKVSDVLLDQFFDFALKHNNIVANSKDQAYSKKRISNLLKAEIARQLWVEQGFYKIRNISDQDVLRAIDFLR